MAGLPLVGLLLCCLQGCHHCLATAPPHPYDPPSLGRGHGAGQEGEEPQSGGNKRCYLDVCAHNLYAHAFCGWRRGSCTHCLKVLQRDSVIWDEQTQKETERKGTPASTNAPLGTVTLATQTRESVKIKSRHKQTRKGDDEHNNMRHDIAPPTPVLPPPPPPPTRTSSTPSSSAWCHTTPESGMQCHFQNLYYSPLHEEFAFISDKDSVMEGIERIEELKGRLHLSSVDRHSAFTFHITAVPRHTLASASITTLEGPSVVMARFKPDNLLHVLHDDLLPVYFTMLRLCAVAGTPCPPVTLLVVDEHGPSPYHDLYRALTYHILLASDLRRNALLWVRMEAATVGLSRHSIWYQYGFGMPQGPTASRLSGPQLRQFVGFMRERLGLGVNAVSDGAVNAVNAPTSVPTATAGTFSTPDSTTAPLPPSYAVLLTRHTTRKILNENQLAEAIGVELWGGAGRGEVKIISLEENGITEAVRVISGAGVLVGMHGAALALGMFMPRGSLLLELWPYGIDPTSAPVYRAMCALEDSGLVYTAWTNEDVHNTRTHPEYPAHYGGLWHMASQERNRIASALYGPKLTSVMCCDDPDWLYRIYQDTEVRLYAHENFLRSVPFTEVLRGGLQMRRTVPHSTKRPQRHTPARVRELRCFLRKQGTEVKLDVWWRKPWTVEALGCGDVTYEVVVASGVKGDGSDVTTDYVQRESYVKRFARVVESLNVWVTCLCGGVEGSALHVNCGVT